MTAIRTSCSHTLKWHANTPFNYFLRKGENNYHNAHVRGEPSTSSGSRNNQNRAQWGKQVHKPAITHNSLCQCGSAHRRAYVSLWRKNRAPFATESKLCLPLQIVEKADLRIRNLAEVAQVEPQLEHIIKIRRCSHTFNRYWQIYNDPRCIHSLRNL